MSANQEAETVEKSKKDENVEVEKVEMEKLDDGLILGLVINQMEENLENEMYNFEKQKEEANDDYNQVLESVRNQKENLRNLEAFQQKQQREVESLKKNYSQYAKELNEIKNFINQRPTQSDKNKWTFQTLSGIAADLISQIENEKERQQELYRQNLLLDFLQNGD
ncbi:hypothetical protein M9Y10_045228 [Tritrichomonas musculus]|uniref:Uncharacterized protein n=1 Tax=Tritrichomonas musculus TaxID=1915356 RepID=A0ABR2JV02_9EUKA